MTTLWAFQASTCRCGHDSVGHVFCPKHGSDHVSTDDMYIQNSRVQYTPYAPCWTHLSLHRFFLCTLRSTPCYVCILEWETPWSWNLLWMQHFLCAVYRRIATLGTQSLMVEFAPQYTTKPCQASACYSSLQTCQPSHFLLIQIFWMPSSDTGMIILPHCMLT